MASSFEILRGWETGQLAAILNKVSGGDRAKLEAILRDETEISIIERAVKLFDKNGRRIPPKDLQAAVCNPDKKFYLVQPRLILADYADRLVRFQEAFKAGPVMSAAEFEGRSKELVSEIRNQKDLANLLNGVYLPVILPKLDSFEDYGRTLEEIFLPAVTFAYEKQFPDRKFYNYRKNDLVDKVSIVEGTRHEQLVGKMTQDYVVAIYFPNSLQGFSVFASREQLSVLPGFLFLAGGFDASVALAMYPDVLARDYQAPGYDLSALIWRSPGYSLYFRADDDGLVFDRGGDLGFANDNYSSGLLFLGSARFFVL